MKSVIRIGVFILIFGLGLPALAISLEQAKNELETAKGAGLVGETPTGYLGTVSSDPQAQEIVDAINQARREEYARIAEKHGIAVTKVESVAGKKAIERTPSGQYVLIEGSWVEK